MAPRRPSGTPRARATDGSPRLAALRRAHAVGPAAHSARVEDYVEVILELIAEKGYARIVDIGEHLHVGAPTVTKTLQRLHADGLVLYERYRGVVLTEEGGRLARDIKRRHDVVADFLRLLGVDEATAHRDTEGLEHHLTPRTLERLARLVEVAKRDPESWRKYRDQP